MDGSENERTPALWVVKINENQVALNSRKLL